MIRVQNKITGEVVEGIGCWGWDTGIAFISNQSHSLIDSDSPVKWDVDKVTFQKWDDISEQYYDVYDVPKGWELI